MNIFYRGCIMALKKMDGLQKTAFKKHRIKQNMSDITWQKICSVGPFTPTNDGINDGKVRDKNGRVFADCNGDQGVAMVMAEFLNESRSLMMGGENQHNG